jgi:hypothetical protein
MARAVVRPTVGDEENMMREVCVVIVVVAEGLSSCRR